MMGPIYFIAGAPGVGKSTTAKALAERFDKTILFDMDYFRALVVKGVAHPVPVWTDETTVQFALAHTAVGKVAQVYAEAGFAVIAEHCAYPHDYELFLKEAPTTKVVCLHASLDVNQARNAGRTYKSFDPKTLVHGINGMAETIYLEYQKAGYLTLENTALSVDQAVEFLLGL